MKAKLLFILLILTTSIALSQVVANQVDDFEDGTTQNWIIGSPDDAVSPPANVTTDGPDGVDDNYLTYTSTPPASGGAGSKMIIFNAGNQWSLNYTSEAIIAIKMDVRVQTTDLNLRVAFQGPNGKRICTTQAVNVGAGLGWTSVTIPIAVSNFTVVGGAPSVTIADALANVSTMRILSSNSPTWTGADTIISTINLDNITAVTTLDVQELSIPNEFEISPNPGALNLNIKLSNTLKDATITIYNVLGKKIFSKHVNAISSSIDVSQWSSGVYLVRISSDNTILTKRFVKQ